MLYFPAESPEKTPVEFVCKKYVSPVFPVSG